jgi:catechol 2,3-dioxygenase-like lactoylglutathione lyase family enzyme
MPRQQPLRSANIIAFVPTLKPDVARTFYHKTLGLRLVGEDDFAVVFDAEGTMIRVANVSGSDFTPAPFTILGWHVGDIEKCVRALRSNGVSFERYEGISQDNNGVWESPSGARIAWFKDPDGNTLSITEL